MRLFLGIYPSQEMLAYFRDVRRQLDKEKRNLRFVDFEKLHITLRFVGSKVSQSTKNKLSLELQRHDGSWPKPEINVEGISLGFPRQKDPRVVMANISVNYELEELIHRLHHNIRDLKKRDTIRWKQRNEADYHITLARMKPAATRSSGRKLRKLIQDIDLPLPEPFVAEEMFMISSDITPRGPVYNKLERFKL